MELTDFIKSFQREKGLVRVINENGEVIEQHETDGIDIDFIDSRWAIKSSQMKAPVHYECD